MPFGGNNSISCCQRVVGKARAGIGFAKAIADDIVVWYGGDEVDHMRRMRVVLERLHAKGLQLSPKKIKLGMHKVEFLWHGVSADGVEPMRNKVEAIKKMTRATNPLEVRSFIGMTTYYCRFSDHYSHVKRQLTELPRKGIRWVLGEAQDAPFQQMKQMLTSTPVLRKPNWKKPFIRSCRRQVSELV